MPGPLEDIIDDTEGALSGFVSPDGVTRVAAGERLTVGEPIVVALTDRRLVVSPRDGDGRTLSIPYSDVVSVTVEDGEVGLTTTDGTIFEWSLSGVAGVSAAEAGRHLRWLGALRGDVLGTRNDVELAAGDIEQAAADLDWAAATERYEDTRRRLDETLARVFAAEPIDPDELAPELTEAGRALERAHARLHARRAESRLDLAQQLLETDAHDQCRKVLRQVQAYAERAQGCGLTVQRGDRFQFGEQREIQRELDELRWRIGAFAAELVTSARDACVAAQDTPARAEAITAYRRALERYGHALALETAREERQLIDSPEAVRRERDRVAAQLIDLHELTADEGWDEGVDRQEAGDREAALQACLDAKGHFERAHDLAVEFAPDRGKPIAARLDTITDVIAQMRTTAEVSERPPEGEARDDGRGAAADLTEMDTHHEVVFEAEGLTEPLARRRQRNGHRDAEDADEEEASPDETSP